MFNAGIVRPGKTLYIPFESFASSTGAPITITGFAVGDVKIYKDGGTTERASTSGFTLLDTDGIDFDGITGIHGFSIDLSDNATADFFQAGSQYWVVVSAVTVDSQTMSFVAATFRIGYHDSLLDTFIATLATQTNFTLNSGPAEDNALNGFEVVIHDAASAVQISRAIILSYIGSTKTVTLAAAPTFTITAKDNFSVTRPSPLQPSVIGRTALVASDGSVSPNWGDVKSPTTTVALSGTTIATTQKVDLETIKTNPVVNAGTATFPANATLASTTNITAGTIATVTNLTNAPTSGDLTSTMKASVTTAATAATPTVTAGTVSDKTGYSLSAGGVTAVQSGLATQADINALNQSASRRIMLVTVPQYERPESGANSYTVEMRTFDGDGAAVNADSDPTLTATGIVSGSLNANLSAVSNPATGVYRWTYSETSGAALEQIRLDGSAVISASTFTLSTYTQSADFIAATWTTTDAANLTAIYNKLPSRAFLTGTTTSTGALLATDQVILTSAYDAAKTAATQSSVDDLPTNAGLATALAAADNAVLAQVALVKAKTDQFAFTVANQVDANALTSGGGGSVPTVDQINTKLVEEHGDGPWNASGAGTGGNDVTITIKNSSNVGIQNAVAWLKINNSLYQSLPADVNGVVHLSPTEGDGEYSLRITANGYVFAPEDITVSGDTTLTKIIVTLNPTPSDPGFITIFGYYKRGSVPVEDVTISITQIRTFGTGLISDTDPRETTTDSDGYWEFIGIIPGASYEITAGETTSVVDISKTATSSSEVRSLLG